MDNHSSGEMDDERDNCTPEHNDEERQEEPTGENPPRSPLQPRNSDDEEEAEVFALSEMLRSSGFGDALRQDSESVHTESSGTLTVPDEEPIVPTRVQHRVGWLRRGREFSVFVTDEHGEPENENYTRLSILEVEDEDYIQLYRQIFEGQSTLDDNAAKYMLAQMLQDAFSGLRWKVLSDVASDERLVPTYAYLTEWDTITFFANLSATILSTHIVQLREIIAGLSAANLILQKSACDLERIQQRLRLAGASHSSTLFLRRAHLKTLDNDRKCWYQTSADIFEGINMTRHEFGSRVRRRIDSDPSDAEDGDATQPVPDQSQTELISAIIRAMERIL